LAMMLAQQGGSNAIDQITQQRAMAQQAMDAMRGSPGEQPLVQMPQFGGPPPGLNPNSMIDVGPEQGLPGRAPPHDLMQRLRLY
jgi:hypothetical protein